MSVKKRMAKNGEESTIAVKRRAKETRGEHNTTNKSPKKVKGWPLGMKRPLSSEASPEKAVLKKVKRKKGSHEDTTESVADNVDESIETVKVLDAESSEDVKSAVQCRTFTDEDKLAMIKSVRKQAEQAIPILREVAAKSKKKTLFPEVDNAIHVQCIYKKPAPHNDKTVWTKHILLPHPLHDEKTTTVCLVMADIDKSQKARFDADVDKQSREWEEILRQTHALTKQHVHKILTVRQMQREYHTYVDKRQLASAYDVFVVDSRVAKSVWHECGKEFHKARKMPFSVDVAKGNLLQQIKNTFSTVTMPLSPHRTRMSLIIGNLSKPSSDLVDNIQEAVARVMDWCPGGAGNLRSIYVQVVSGGPTIPIYGDAGSANEVRFPKAKKKSELPQRAITEGELSTLPEGLEVAVRADGKIRVLDSQSRKTVYYPTVNDEWEEGDDLKPRIDPAKIEEKRAKKTLKRARVTAAKKNQRAKLANKEGAETKEGKVVKGKKVISNKKDFGPLTKALMLSTGPVSTGKGNKKTKKVPLHNATKAVPKDENAPKKGSLKDKSKKKGALKKKNKVEA